MKAGLLSFLVAQAALAQAGAAPTLRQLLDSAERQNVDRRISSEQRARVEAEYRMAWTSLLPSLTAQGAWTHNQYDASFLLPDDSTADPFDTRKLTLIPFDQLDGVLRFDLPLVDASRWVRLAAGAEAQQAAASREALTSDLVRKQVVVSYYVYAAALAVRDSAKRSHTVAEAQLKLMEIREKAGASTELDLLRSRAEVQRVRQLVADTGNLVASSRRMLRSASGLDPGEEARLPPDDLAPEQPFEELERRVDELPGVQAADHDAAAAGRIAWGTRLAFVPVVGAQFTERFTNATGFTGKASAYNAGMTLTWRLDVPMVMGLEVARANEATALLAGERVRLVSRDQIHADWQRLTAALTKISAAGAQVQAAQRAAQVARDKYAVGLATQLEVITAERDLFNAEVAQIQARTEAASARASLRISAGLPLGVD